MVVDLRKKVIREIPYLRRFALALTGSITRADNLVALCLEQAVSRMYLYNPRYRLRVWLYAIVRDVYTGMFKEAAKRGQYVEAAPVPDNLISEDVNYEARMLTIDLARALETLEVELREVFLLVVLEDFTYDETADVVSAPIGTVVSRLTRARRRIEMTMRENVSQSFEAIEVVDPVL